MLGFGAKVFAKYLRITIHSIVDPGKFIWVAIIFDRYSIYTYVL